MLPDKDSSLHLKAVRPWHPLRPASLPCGRDNYFAENMGDEEDIEQQGLDDRSPLDKTIDRIGMGAW